MSIANTAQNLIKSRGRSMTYKTITLGEYDTSTGGATTTTKEVAVMGVVTETSESRDEGHTVPVITRRVLISGLAGVSPKVEDRIKIGLDDYVVQVVRSAEIAGGVIVVYDLEVVRA